MLRQAMLAGRLLLDEGPTPVLIRNGVGRGRSRAAPTIADLMELAEPDKLAGERLFRVDELCAHAR